MLVTTTSTLNTRAIKGSKLQHFLSNNAISFIKCQISKISHFLFCLTKCTLKFVKYIIVLQKNVASRDKTDHRFGISATNLVNLNNLAIKSS